MLTLFVISDLPLSEWRRLEPGQHGHEARLPAPGHHQEREDGGAGAGTQGADTQGGPLRPVEPLGSLSQKQGKIKEC